MKWLWKIFGYFVFDLPRGARLVQKKALCDQTAISNGVDSSTSEEKWCPISQFTFIVMDGEFQGQYETAVVSEVRRFKKNLLRRARVHIKISANEISQSRIMALIHEAQRD